MRLLHYIILLTLLSACPDLFAQQHLLTSSALKVVTLQSEQKFYINSQMRPLGRSRVFVPVHLPPNTVAWCYKYAAFRDEKDAKNVLGAIRIAVQLTRLIDQNAGLIAAALEQLAQPPGGNVCDLYLMDTAAYKGFFETNFFGLYANTRPEYIKEGTRENFASGVVSVQSANYQNGNYFIGIRNPDPLYGLHVVIEVAAIVQDPASRSLVPAGKDLRSLKLTERQALGSRILDKAVGASGGVDAIKKQNQLMMYGIMTNKLGDKPARLWYKLPDYQRIESEGRTISVRGDSLIYTTSREEDAFSEEIQVNFPMRLYNLMADYQELHINPEYTEIERIKLRDCYKVKFAYQKSVDYLLIDTATLQLRMYRHNVHHTFRTQNISEDYYADYEQQSSGVNFPKYIEHRRKKAYTRFLIRNIMSEPSLRDSFFYGK